MKPEFSRSIDIRSFLSKGAPTRFEANAEERKNLAKRFDVLGLRKFQVDFSSSREGPGVFTLSGKIDAELDQTCARTLQPMETSVDETFKVTMMEPEIFEEMPEEREETPEDIELLDRETLDLGELAAQYLSLAIDPFPHKTEKMPQSGSLKGVNVYTEEDHKEEEGPFAELKKLKNKG